ncbi:hypothetical protein MRX96_017111 [Rhipicephalus microplus]
MDGEGFGKNKWGKRQETGGGAGKAGEIRNSPSPGPSIATGIAMSASAAAGAPVAAPQRRSVCPVDLCRVATEEGSGEGGGGVERYLRQTAGASAVVSLACGMCNNERESL